MGLRSLYLFSQSSLYEIRNYPFGFHYNCEHENLLSKSFCLLYDLYWTSPVLITFGHSYTREAAKVLKFPLQRA